MARTIAEIQAEMVAAKEASSNLSGLTSTSQTAVWNLLFYICAVAIKFIEDLYDVFSDQIEDRKLEIPTGVLKWYASETLVYQFGDSLEFTNSFVNALGETVVLIGNAVTYNPINPDNYVVDLAAADIVNGVVIIKAAKLVSGTAEPLSGAELSGLDQYWTQKRFAGTSISIVSQDPDQLKAYYLITYDSQLLSPTGEDLSNSGVFPVEDAINTFLQSYSDENFAGTMQVMKLTDAIQSAKGVLNAVATEIEARPTAGTYTDVLAIAQQVYTAQAGYMEIDPAFPLSTTLTYSPNS